MNRAGKAAVVAGLFLMFIGSGAAADIFVEGLDEESVNRTFTADGVRFTTEYLNKTIPFKNATYPDEFHDGLTKWTTSVTDKNNSYQMDFQSTWATNASAPAYLHGRKVNEKFSMKKGETKSTLYNGSFQDDSGVYAVNVSAEAHLEHLILNYTLINSTGHVIEYVNNTYSGEETEKIPVAGDVRQINTTHVEQDITRDGLHEPGETEQLVVGHENETEIVAIDSPGDVNVTQGCSATYSGDVEPALDAANMSSSSYIEDTAGYEFACYNVSYPADSEKTVTVTYRQPEPPDQRDGRFGVIDWDFTYRSYLLGSVASFTTDTTSEWSGGEFTYATSFDGKLTTKGKGLEILYADQNGVGYFDRSGESGTIGDLYSINGVGGAGDFDGDGDMDVAYRDYDSSNLSYTDAQGNQVIMEYSTADVGGIVDFDEDGDKEILYQDRNTDDLKYVDFSGNVGNTDQRVLRIGGTSDYDDDGNLEVFYTDRDSNLKYVDHNKDVTDLGEQSHSVTHNITDFDGDGDTDIVYIDTNGNIKYTDGVNVVDVGVNTASLGGIGDFDEDGDVDIAHQDSNGNIHYLDSTGNNVDTGVDGFTTPIGTMVDFDDDADNNEWGNYTSKFYNASEEKIWENMTVGGLSQPGSSDVNVTVTSYNSGAQVESVTLTSLADGTNQYSTGFSQGATDVRFTVDMAEGSAPSVENITVSGKTANKAPVVENTTLRDDRKQNILRLENDVDDKGESDIGSYDGLSNVLMFSNSTLDASMGGFPYTASFNVSDWKGAFSSQRNIDVDETDTGLREDDYQHDLTTQRINRTVTIYNNAADTIRYNLTFDNYGSLVTAERFTGDVAGSSTVTETGVWSGDWLTDIRKGTKQLGQNTSKTSDLSTQYLYNQTNLSVTNQRSFQFTAVDISTECSQTTTATIPAGTSEVTASCTNKSNSGDWIQDTQHGFTPSTDEITLGISYLGDQKIQLNNTRSVSWTDINTSVGVSGPDKCVQTSNSLVDIGADAETNISVEFQCDPGTPGSGVQTLVDEGDKERVWFNISGIQIYSNASEETRITRKVDEDNLKNWNQRDAGSVTVYADGSTRDMSFTDGESYTYLHVGKEHGNSSLHEGNHTMALTYTYTTESPLPGGDGGDGGSDGSSDDGEDSDETEEFDVSFDTRNPYTVSPGSTSQESFTVNNFLAQENTVALTELTDQYRGCQYIDVQRSLNRSRPLDATDFGDSAVYNLLSRTKGAGFNDAYSPTVQFRVDLPSKANLTEIEEPLECGYHVNATKGNAEDLLLKVRPEENAWDRLNTWIDDVAGTKLFQWEQSCFGYSALQTDETCTTEEDGFVWPRPTGAGVATAFLTLFFVGFAARVT